MSYAGWKNRETWNVNLWVMNDEHIYEAWKKLKFHYGVFTEKNARATARGLFSTKTPDGVLVRSRKIDWKEIANAWNED